MAGCCRFGQCGSPSGGFGPIAGAFAGIAPRHDSGSTTPSGFDRRNVMHGPFLDATPYSLAPIAIIPCSTFGARKAVDRACWTTSSCAGGSVRWSSILYHHCGATRPTRLDDYGLLRQWKPSYAYGIRMQASLALRRCRTGCNLADGDWRWAVGAALILANWRILSSA